MVRQHQKQQEEVNKATRQAKKDWRQLQRETANDLLKLLKKGKLDRAAQVDIFLEINNNLDNPEQYVGHKRDTNEMLERLRTGLIAPTGLKKIREKINSYNPDRDDTQKVIQQTTSVVMMGIIAGTAKIVYEHRR